jgi:hypothetical protein
MVRALPKSAKAQVNYRFGAPQPLHLGPGHDPLTYGVGFEFAIDPGAVAEKPLNVVADMEDSPGGRYPQDGP